MENMLVETIKPITLEKENLPPLTIESGTLLKVILRSPTVIFVRNDGNFNFTLPLTEKNKTWRAL